MLSTGSALTKIQDAASALDEALVGQERAKQAVLIGSLAREHVLLEGAPGCGKSALANAAARLLAAPSECHLCSFHRDTKREDLLGTTHLLRETLGAGERLTFALDPGPLLRASVVVLDDIGRAPGEALAPLLRLLGSRTADLGRGQTIRLPLEMAIATTTEVGADSVEIDAVDPLEPSQLDRFALQVRMRGLISERRWRQARTVMANELGITNEAALPAGDPQESAHPDSAHPDSAHPQSALSRSKDQDSGAVPNVAALWQDRAALQAWVSHMPYPGAVQQRVKSALSALARRVRQNRTAHRRAVLSDRVFGAVLPKLLRAHAAVHGRDEVAIEDVRVLRLIVAQRIPEELLAMVDEVLDEVISQPAPESQQSVGEGEESVPMVADENNDQVETDAMPGQVPGAPTTEGELPEPPPLPPRRRKPRPADVEPLIRAFEGRLDRGRSDLDDDPGGQPRGFRPMRRFDEVIDADPIDALLLVDGILAGPPRVVRRRRRTLGGAVVVARDVSSSMAGFRNDWASELICGLVRASARRRMRVGYLEFHQRAMPRLIGGRLLHRRYEQLHQVVREARPMGQTNYEAPLRMALDALRGRRGRNRHVVLLTDGLPILGDTSVRAERALAKKLGVSLHTVFIGDGDSPPVLDAISKETGGLRFQAIESAGALELLERRELVA